MDDPSQARRAGGSPSRLADGAMLTGSVALTACAAMALLMTLEHLGRMKLPGCGPGSACAAAAASRWGSIPGIDWPVSFVGLAFYAAIGAAWSASRDGVSTVFRMAVRLGGIVSLGFVGIMVVERRLCPYCLAAHLAFLVFWCVFERAPRARTGSRRQLITAAPMFVLVTAALIPIELMERSAARRQAERDLSESTARMVESPREWSALTEVTAEPRAVAVLPSVLLPRDARGAPDRFLLDGLTGRHRVGPEKSPIRLVVFSDFQCKDCRRIETQIRSLIKQRTDMSLSARHFPMCSDCNRHVPRSLHANACWAARAAEAAAILGGTDGFWKMHGWLFDRGGAFTDKVLREALPGLGFERAEFVRLMTGDETLAPVTEDIELGVALGLHFTPMIFINGVELRGWNAPNAVTRAITTLAASHPPAMTAAADRPPPAIDKYIEDWGRQRVVTLTDARDWMVGEQGATVDLVMFGDYRESNCAEADRAIQQLVTGSPGVRYHYRHYPFNKDCNPGVTSTRYPLACLAAKAAEAAGELGGDNAYWKMHVWLFENQAGFSDQALNVAIGYLGLDASEFERAMESEDVAAAVLEDAAAGGRLRFRSIPAIFVNGKYVPRWRRDGEPILEQIVAEAAQRSGRAPHRP